MQRTMCVLVVLACGCAAEVGEPPALDDTGAAELIDGDYTYAHPEVGRIQIGTSSCTATLFGSARTVITAAHCVGYGSSSEPSAYGSLVLSPRAGVNHRYTIRQIVSFGGAPGTNDVALLQLSTAVPASVATPAPPVATRPSSGERVTVYGYGCQDRETTSGPRRKQAVQFRWGSETEHLCPGDSGGPTLTAEGEVAQVNSSYGAVSGVDRFGDVRANRSRLREYVDAWRGREPLVWEPGASTAPGPVDACGELAGVTELTCVEGGERFVRCTSSGMQVARCPDGSRCRPGSTELVCYR